MRITDTTLNNFKKFRYINVELSAGRDIAIVNLNGPRQENFLNEEVAEEVHQIINALDADEGIIGIVVASAKPNSFAAGADINVLEKVNGKKAIDLCRLCQQEYKKIENSRLPTVAAVMGNCMGGGLELILACKYRMCMDTDTTVFALPEVKLGLIPAGGGTQRLPKKIFLPTALDMLVTGRTITAKTAYKYGLIEELLEPVLNEYGEVDEAETLELLKANAVVTARHFALNLRSPRTWFSTLINIGNYFASSWLIWNYLIKTTFIQEMKRRGMDNMLAPSSVIKSVEAALFNKSDIGYKIEREEFGYLVETKETAALIGLFHGITKYKKYRFGEPSEIRSVCIVGTSEAGLACACHIASRELSVVVIPEDGRTGCRKASEYIRSYLTKKGRRSESIAEVMKNILVTDCYEELKNADFILISLEASTSDDEYNSTLNTVDSLSKTDVTVMIHLFGRSLNHLVKITRNPSRVVGVCCGFPHKTSKYAEIIKHNTTDRQAVADAALILRKQKLLMLVTEDKEDTPGYYLVHCILSMLQTACEEILNGTITSAKDMDKLTRGANFIGGIAKLCDLIGLDAIYNVCQRYNVQPSTVELLKQLIKQDRRGIKNGKGFHLYDSKNQTAANDPVFEECVKKLRQTKLPSASHEWNADPHTKMIVNLVDTALRCYESGLITAPDEGDVGCVFGVGFPPAYGGPFRYITQRKTEIAKMVEGNKNLCQLFQSQLLNEVQSKKFY